jgi:BppU N-terminal domain
VADQFYIKRNDLSPSMVYTLSPAVDLNGATAVFNMRHASTGTVVVLRGDVTIVDAAAGVVRYDWTQASTLTAGEYEAEFEVTLPGALPATFPNYGFIQVIITDDIDGPIGVVPDPVYPSYAALSALATEAFPLTALFNAGLPGDLFVADRNRLFQDRAGTTPVTAVSQPVRAIRGVVKGTLLATSSDIYYGTYVEVDGIGYIQAGANSQGFAADFSGPVDYPDENDLQGDHLNNHGFLIGISSYLTSAGLANTSSMFWSVGGNGTSVAISSPRVTNDGPFCYYYGYEGDTPMFEEVLFDTTLSGVILPVKQKILMFQKDTSISALISLSSGDYASTGSEWTKYANMTYAEVASLPLTELEYTEAIPPFSVELYNADNGTTLTPSALRLSLSSRSNAANTGMHFRAAIAVGKGVDPSLHQLILDAL